MSEESSNMDKYSNASRGIFEMLRHGKRASELSDLDLISHAVEDVWADIDMTSWESAILDELIQRFNSTKSNQEKPPEPLEWPKNIHIMEPSFWDATCPQCGSSLKLKWFFKKKCIHPECGWSN